MVLKLHTESARRGCDIVRFNSSRIVLYKGMYVPLHRDESNVQKASKLWYALWLSRLYLCLAYTRL